MAMAMKIEDEGMAGRLLQSIDQLIFLDLALSAKQRRSLNVLREKLLDHMRRLHGDAKKIDKMSDTEKQRLVDSGSYFMPRSSYVSLFSGDRVLDKGFSRSENDVVINISSRKSDCAAKTAKYKRRKSDNANSMAHPSPRTESTAFNWLHWTIMLFTLLVLGLAKAWTEPFVTLYLHSSVTYGGSWSLGSSSEGFMNTVYVGNVTVASFETEYGVASCFKEFSVEGLGFAFTSDVSLDCSVASPWDDLLTLYFIDQTAASYAGVNLPLPSNSTWIDSTSFWLGLPLKVLSSFDDGGRHQMNEATKVMVISPNVDFVSRYPFYYYTLYLDNYRRYIRADSYFYVAEIDWGRRARFRCWKNWEKQYAMDEARVRRALCLFQSIFSVGCLIAGAAFSLSKPSAWSSGQILASFAFRLGSLAFISSLHLHFLALNCTKVVVSSLIAKFGRKAGGCYRIAVRTLHF